MHLKNKNTEAMVRSLYLTSYLHKLKQDTLFWSQNCWVEILNSLVLEVQIRLKNGLEIDKSFLTNLENIVW